MDSFDVIISPKALTQLNSYIDYLQYTLLNDQAPVSSQMPKNMDYNVKVDKVYGFPEMPRWANVTKITQVSLSRVHFEQFGDVKPAV